MAAFQVKKVGILGGGYLIDLVTVSDAILTGRQTCLEIQCLYGNPMSNYFHTTSEKSMN